MRTLLRKQKGKLKGSLFVFSFEPNEKLFGDEVKEVYA